jgi:hypothetical protein
VQTRATAFGNAKPDVLADKDPLSRPLISAA